jgi:hypothetical protein
MVLMCSPEMAKEKTTAKRKFTGQRISDDFLARIDRIAEKQKTSPRAVMEQLFERGLPDLERLYGIDQEKPQK